MNPPSGAKDTRAVRRPVWMTMLFVMLRCVVLWAQKVHSQIL
jgi:hypothetical protein